MKKRPKVGLGIMIIKDGKVLLGKRKNAHGAGEWCFPGGHLEFNESFGHCAKRETFEEAGIKIKNIRFLTATNDVFKKEKKHYITIYMKADYASGNVAVKEPDRMHSWKWFKRNNLPKPLFIPIRNLLKQGKI